MGRKYQVISGDGHLETPPDFVAFLPEKYKDRAPKLISLPDGGGDAWLMEGMPLTYASQNLRGRGKVKFAGQSYFKDDGSRTNGAGDGAQRLREQDEDGLDAELLFVPVFASRFLEKIPDHDAYLAMVRAYYIGHLGKYVPGKALVVVMRVALVVPAGVRIGIIKRAHDRTAVQVHQRNFAGRVEVIVRIRRTGRADQRQVAMHGN